jgi:hypothetical protein
MAAAGILDRQPRLRVESSQVSDTIIAINRFISLRFTFACGLLLLALAAGGCTRPQSADQALEKALQATGGSREDVAKVGGTVMIDDRPPGDTGPSRILVILYDPKKPDALKKSPTYAVCDEEGRFAFTTYVNEDGVPPGTYVVLFARLRMQLMGGMGYGPPDELKNAYNDPEQNEKISDFKIEVALPGKTDYHFDLKTPDGDATVSPGPLAVTSIR